MKLLRFIRFNDKRTRPRRRENDKYAPIRDLWETVMNNTEKSFFPRGEVTIDEQLFLCGSSQCRCQSKLSEGALAESGGGHHNRLNFCT